MAGYAIFLATFNANIRYGAIFLTASTAFTLGAMANAQVSANVISDSARSIAIATNGKLLFIFLSLTRYLSYAVCHPQHPANLSLVMFGNIGGLIATWTFIPSDAPGYRIGNGLNLACAILWTTIAIAAGLWMRYDNRKRDEREAGAHELRDEC